MEHWTSDRILDVKALHQARPEKGTPFLAVSQEFVSQITFELKEIMDLLLEVGSPAWN